MNIMPQTSDAVLFQCKNLVSTEGMEAVLSFLKKAGFSSIAAIKAIVDLEGLSLNEAHRIVALSPSWNRVNSKNADDQ